LRLRLRFDILRITTKRTRIHECFAFDHLFKTFKFTFDYFILRRSRKLRNAWKTRINHVNVEINKWKQK
jgi:hypothetical protein